MEKSGLSRRLHIRQLLMVVVLGLALFVLVPQFGDFQASWQLLRRPDVGWTALAVGLAALTYLAAAATYWLLAFARLGYGRLVLVQLAAMFINRLLPAGVGALGVNFLFLKRNKHTAAKAGSVVAINNLLGFSGHWLLVAVATALYADEVAALSRGSGQSGHWWLFAAAVVVLLAGILFFKFGRQRFVRGIRDVGQQLLSYRQRPWRPAAALLSSITLTAANVGALACCALAVGIDLPPAVVLLIFTFGISAGTATPTPGGLGGFEAGLVAGFVAYHVPSAAALAAALLFRIITYWLALLAGAAAFAICQRRQLLGV